MAVLFLSSFFFCLYYLFKGRQDLAFLNVYLPCLLLIPSYYSYRIPHLPPQSVAQWALLPLGIALLFAPPVRLTLRRMDLWLLLFMVSFGVSEFSREADAMTAQGISYYENMSLQMVFAYIVGRFLIEPNLRLPTVRRIVLLFLCMTPVILYEYRMGQNVWINIGTRVFAVQTGSIVAIRSGHTRVQACFGHPILAGILFFIVFLFNAALVDAFKRSRKIIGPFWAGLQGYHAPAALFILFLFLTQSRGPLISALVGYSILQIPRFRNRWVGATVVLLVLGIGGAAGYSYFDKYTNTINTGSLSEQQRSAIYRRELLKNYEPVLEKGGWLGWGALSHPQVAGQSSIDNSYMLMQLSQGKLGLYLFLLMAAEAVFSTARCAFFFRARESRFFAFVLLGVLLGLFASIYTVYLGEQLVQVLFLLLGWSQSLQDIGEKDGVPEKYHFKRVFA